MMVSLTFIFMIQKFERFNNDSFLFDFEDMLLNLDISIEDILLKERQLLGIFISFNNNIIPFIDIYNYLHRVTNTKNSDQLKLDFPKFMNNLCLYSLIETKYSIFSLSLAVFLFYKEINNREFIFTDEIAQIQNHFKGLTKLDLQEDILNIRNCLISEYRKITKDNSLLQRFSQMKLITTRSNSQAENAFLISLMRHT